MKKNIRIIAALLAVLMLATGLMSGCSKDENAASGSNAPEEKKVLIMATNAEFPPYEYVESNEIVGIDVEIAAAIAEKLGMTLKVENMEFESIISYVNSGKADIGAAGMTVNEERLQNVSFTTSYATGVQVVIVKEGSAITSVDDLFEDGAAFNIGVQEATTGDLYISDDTEDYGLGHKIERYSKGADAVQALSTGKIDCVIIDNEPAKAFIAAKEGLKILDTEYTEEDYAICVDKDNTELLNKINAALEELIADGTVQSIIDKYINAD